jgi:hypothetical protein
VLSLDDPMPFLRGVAWPRIERRLLAQFRAGPDPSGPGVKGAELRLFH